MLGPGFFLTWNWFLQVNSLPPQPNLITLFFGKKKRSKPMYPGLCFGAMLFFLMDGKVISVSSGGFGPDFFLEGNWFR